MMPTADEFAVAIIAACRETGADPVDVVTGAEREHGCPIEKSHAISRARLYAGRAIDKVFNRPDVAIARPVIARLVGVNKPSWESFFSSADIRLRAATIRWWDEAALKRVVDAVMDFEPSEDAPPVKLDGPSVSPEPRSDNRTVEKVNQPPPYKGPGYRGPADLMRQVLEDDDDRPIFDRGSLGGRKPPKPPAVKSKREMMEDLAQAVRNTAARSPSEE